MALPLSMVKAPTFCGIDVKPSELDVIIGDCHPASNFDPFAPAHVIRPVFIGKVHDEHEALFMLQQYRPRLTLADARPDTSMAERLQRMAEKVGLVVWRAQYHTQPGGTVEMTKNDKENLVTLERTMTLDHVLHAFQTGQSVILPQNYRHITEGRFARQMTNSVRTYFRTGAGRDVWIWEKQGEDDALHSFNLMLTAYRMSDISGWSSIETMGATKGIVESTLEENFSIERDFGIFYES